MAEGSQGESSDSDVEQVARKRGKRRRGRKDTSELVRSIQKETDEAKTAGEKPVAVEVINLHSSIEEKHQRKRQKMKKNDTRYCVGRKPVTDFAVGSKHDGKVIYVKPFGIFIDIGCHSDAFCHVSRLQDGFVESPGTLFKPGDEVKGARIVEIDRKNKRITVSLQSDSMIETELASVSARQERMEKQKMKRKKTKESYFAPDKGEQTQCVSSFTLSQAVSSSSKPSTRPTTELTHQELKRKRKLERRAARRAEQERITSSDEPTEA
jgi:transcriptional accessory protein Tex/SPT6